MKLDMGFPTENAVLVVTVKLGILTSYLLQSLSCPKEKNVSCREPGGFFGLVDDW